MNKRTSEQVKRGGHAKTSVGAPDVRSLLRGRFNDARRYAIAEEVGNATGLEQHRRLDMVIVDCYKSNRYSIEGIEIKVSKADLRRELQDSSKHNIFFPNLDFYSLAAPESIIDMDIIPPKWGVYVVKQLPNDDLRLYTRRKPLSLHDEVQSSIDRPFAASLIRALSCQSPTKAQLDEAREDGYQRGWRRANEEFSRTPASRENVLMREKLDAYEKLYEKCEFWGAHDIERSVEQFEKYRKVRLDDLERKLKYLSDDLVKVLDVISGGTNEKEA